LASLVGAIALLGSVILAGATAEAQTTTTQYQPGTSLPQCTAGNANAGTVSVNQKITFTLCGNFAVNASVAIALNGIATGITKTPTLGAITTHITVTSTSSVDVDDPVAVAIACGATDTVSATGPTATGTTATENGTFVVQCATTSTTTGNPLAFTGANVLKALIAALVLIGLGTALVLFQRRRRQAL
jgi:hypothetical protein